MVSSHKHTHRHTHKQWNLKILIINKDQKHTNWGLLRESLNVLTENKLCKHYPFHTDDLLSCGKSWIYHLITFTDFVADFPESVPQSTMPHHYSERSSNSDQRGLSPSSGQDISATLTGTQWPPLTHILEQTIQNKSKEVIYKAGGREKSSVPIKDGGGANFATDHNIHLLQFRFPQKDKAN